MTSVKLKEGDRVRLDAPMAGEEFLDPIPVGTQGVVVFVDDGETAHVKWDNGRTLGLFRRDSYTRLASTPSMIDCQVCGGTGQVHGYAEQAPGSTGSE